jgi:deoxyribose-phosphate aldolase
MKSSTTIFEPDQAKHVSLGERNPGMPLDLDWVSDVRVNLSAVERRSTSLTGRRTVKKQWQAAWLLKAVSCIDLTTLAGDDTAGKVRRLCAKARQPIRPDLVEALRVSDLGLTDRQLASLIR